MPKTSSSRAVIDLGTNTFHLLIVRYRPEQDDFEEIHRDRHFIKLAEEGIERIGEAAIDRARKVLLGFRRQMDANGVELYRAFGTAAFRNAANGPAFVDWAAQEAGIEITTIDGYEEARLITQGVLLALPPLKTADNRLLIMDIGGGSVEFIIVDGDGLRYAESFPVGVAILRRSFHRHEPIGSEELAELQAHLYQVFAPLRSALERSPTDHLVGAAGTFDVIARLMARGRPTKHSHAIDLDQFDALHLRCRQATLNERMAMSDLPDNRADMMVVALELIHSVLEMAGVNRLTVSDYSLKEGALLEMG
ncbi:hypothetical protein CEQ90_12885 [Lewinellaceae bacterium SD302]|nr:hypothetical protein CEQ90_12885 [Lewinellaceae bacterium SD302]